MQNDLSKTRIKNHHLHDQYVSASASYANFKKHTANSTGSSVKKNVEPLKNEQITTDEAHKAQMFLQHNTIQCHIPHRIIAIINSLNFLQVILT